jgi:hypothetical protein
MNGFGTIIVGGGISGLAAGRTLQDAGREDFLLLSPELGGRMLTSKSLTVDYGASYITSEYQHVRRYIDKGDPLRMSDLSFVEEGTVAPLISSRVLGRLPKLALAAWYIHDLQSRIRRFRKRCLHMSQREAAQQDPVLVRYASLPAADFVRMYGFEGLSDIYFRPTLNSTAFIDIDRANTLYFLAVLAPLVRETHVADFRHAVPRLTSGWRDKIRETSVVEIRHSGARSHRFVVKTPHGEYGANNIVLALPHHQARKIYPVPKPAHQVPMYVFHVVGEREEVYRNQKVIFFKPKEHDVTILWKQSTGSDVLFSHEPNPVLDKYFTYHTVIRRIHWQSALSLAGPVDEWVEQKLEDGLYLASILLVFTPRTRLFSRNDDSGETIGNRFWATSSIVTTS